MTYHQITQEERYAITAQLMCGRSQTQIAQLLGRDRSTISRELRRNRTHHDGKYRAEKAHSYAVARRRRCRRRAHFSSRTWRWWRGCCVESGAPNKLPGGSENTARCVSATKRST